MILAELRQKPFQGVAFAVILTFTILLEDRFRHQGNDFLAAGTDDRRAEHLMMVGDLAIAMMFFQAPRAMDLAALAELLLVFLVLLPGDIPRVRVLKLRLACQYRGTFYLR